MKLKLIVALLGLSASIGAFAVPLAPNSPAPSRWRTSIASTPSRRCRPGARRRARRTTSSRTTSPIASARSAREFRHRPSQKKSGPKSARDLAPGRPALSALNRIGSVSVSSITAAVVRAEDRVQRLVRTLVFRCRTPHPAAKGLNRPFIGEP